MQKPRLGSALQSSKNRRFLESQFTRYPFIDFAADSPTFNRGICDQTATREFFIAWPSDDSIEHFLDRLARVTALQERRQRSTYLIHVSVDGPEKEFPFIAESSIQAAAIDSSRGEQIVYGSRLIATLPKKTHRTLENFRLVELFCARRRRTVGTPQESRAVTASKIRKIAHSSQ